MRDSDETMAPPPGAQVDAPPAPAAAEDAAWRSTAEIQLFRPEALLAARDRFGTPARLAGLTGPLLTLFLAALLVATVTFLATARYARKETVVGFLEPKAGAMRVIAPRGGVIGAVTVEEGEDVVAGQPLAALETDPTTGQGETLSTLLTHASDGQIESLRQQLRGSAASTRAALAGIAEKRAGLERDLQHARSAITLGRQRLALAEQTAEASRTLYAKQYLSAIVLRQREDAALAARQALEDLERTVAAIPSTIAQLDAQADGLMAQRVSEDAAIQLQIAQLDEKRVNIGASSRVSLVSPGAGRVAAFRARNGTSVAANDVIAIVLPKGAMLQAELWVPSRAIGFVKPGDRVRLMYEAFPYQRFGVGEGSVARVDKSPTQPRDLPFAVKTEEALYRVTVNVPRQTILAYGQQRPLMPGMRLTADLILEEESLLGWMFDALRAATMRGVAG